MIAAPSNFNAVFASDENALHDRLTPASADDGDALSIDPGAPVHGPRSTESPASSTSGERLAEEYERARRGMLRMNSPVLRAGYDGETLLDKCDPEALVDAADIILQNQAAREAIRAAARLEQSWRSSKRDGAYWRVDPADELVRVLTKERDRAVEFLYDLRKRQQKLKHLEAITQRAVNRAEAETKPSASGPIPCTPVFLCPPNERESHVVPGAVKPRGRAVAVRPFRP